MQRARQLIILAGLALVIVRCSNDLPTAQIEPPPPGLAAEPKWLTFTCVEPGCDTTLTAIVKVLGSRDVAIKRIVLSDRDRDDFVITPSRTPPFILTSAEILDIEVNYKPTGDPRLGDLDLRVTFTDASASDSDDRIPPGELIVPFVRRLIGEPKLAVDPESINFGPVLVSARKTLPLTIKNDGFGNIGLVIDSIEPDPPGEIRVENLPTQGLIPGETWDLDVIYSPVQESYLEGSVIIQPAAGSLIPTKVPLIGTSIPRATIAVEPAAGIDFGDVPVLSMTSAVLSIQNRGAEYFFISDVSLLGSIPGATLDVELAGGVTTTTVTALEFTQVDFALETIDAGEINTHLRITSNDPQTPILDVPVIGLITKPVINAAPASVDFGAVPKGWTVSRPLEINNSGFGELEVTNVSMILGSSELFNLVTVPSLPITLGHAERVGLEIEFRSEAEATFNGTLAIDSNDPDTPFIEIPLLAVGASCDAGCPIANGVPTCTSGNCEIESCDPDFYDADLDASTGCECREIGNDPGEFCAQGKWLGTLVDEDDDRVSFTGILPTQDDVDVLKFFGRDDFGFGSDDFDVRISLQSTDPNIQFCAYHHDTGQHLNECFWENERCPANRSYRRDGSTGPDDSADFTVKVFRNPQGAPSCTTYTVFISNG